MKTQLKISSCDAGDSATIVWTDEQGKPDGAVSYGIGFNIFWQRGTLSKGRNGAFLIDVLQCLIDMLRHHQKSEFACEENADALGHLQDALNALQQRRDRRQNEGTLGTHQPDGK